MATLYITSTANTGTGTLRTLIENAANGDTICPSPTVFTSGTVCNVTLTEPLTISKSLNFTEGTFAKLVITSNSTLTVGTNSSSSNTIYFYGVDFRGFSGTSDSAIKINGFKSALFVRCSFCGMCGKFGAVRLNPVYLYDAKFYSCAFYGNKTTYEQEGSSAVYFAKFSYYRDYYFYSCTFGANYNPSGRSNYPSYITPPQLVDVVSSESEESEWRTPPSSEYNYDTWTNTAYQTMDTRPSSTASWRQGSTTAINNNYSNQDLDGKTRYANGALGAYEYFETLATPTISGFSAPKSSFGVILASEIEHATTYRYQIATNSTFTSGVQEAVSDLVYDGQPQYLYFTGLSDNTTYYLRARAESSDVMYEASEWSSTYTVSPFTTLATPQIKDFPLASDNTKYSTLQVRLSSTIANANNYKYQIATNSTFTTGLLTRTSSSVSNGYPVSGYFTGLTPGTKYYCRVCAAGVFWNNTWDSQWSTTKTATVPSLPLATPTGLAVSNVAYASTYAKQTVTWNAVTNATSYKLEWKKSTDSTWTAETVSGSTSMSFDSRARNTTYDYRVTAIGNGTTYENSAASATVSLKTKQQLATPSALTCVSKTTTSLTFEWSPVTGTKTYALGYKLTSASSYTYILTESTSATITGLTANTAYNVLVQSREATDATNYDESAYSSALTATTLTPLSAPTGLTSSSVTSSSATISWTAVTNASSYQITYTPSGGTSTTVTSATNSVALTNLSGATSYSVEVVAVGDGTTYMDSSSSSALSFTTLQKLATPTGLKVTNDAVITTTAKQTITWNTVANATGYKLEYKQSTSTTWGSVTRTAPPVIFPNRTRNVSYDHRVTALGDGTTYEDSDTSSVVTKKTKRQLATPTGLTCTNKTATSLTFSWNEVSGTKTYYLRYLLPTASSHSYVYASSSPATITGLTPGTTYNIDISARVATDSTNYDGSVYTDKTPVTTLTQLSAPTGLTHDQVTSSSARVGWNAVTNATDYKVEYRVQGATDWTEDQQ